MNVVHEIFAALNDSASETDGMKWRKCCISSWLRKIAKPDNCSPLQSCYFEVMDFRSIVQARLRECEFKISDLAWRLKGVVPSRSIYAFLEGKTINSDYLARIFEALYIHARCDQAVPPRRRNTKKPDLKYWKLMRAANITPPPIGKYWSWKNDMETFKAGNYVEWEKAAKRWQLEEWTRGGNS